MDETLSRIDDDELVNVRRWRRRLAVAGAVVVVLAVLALIPPLVNVNRYQRRITSTLSASLGRPVHLDSVTLHLLPFPGFTLTNFVVSEDPAFGDEPTIRANSVEAHIRISSLWRRRVEFSRVRFLEPSLNLVRNPQGRWNLDNVLVHAARIDAAPTGQPRASEAPRFPYIEATGARVNIKRGDEKMPFSLTDADFALWLPSAQQWRVRLTGRPSRTDANIADAGVLRLEGALEHATRLEEVPVDLTASWHDAPLGEATRLLTGDDRGWRGIGQVDATLQGHLGTASVHAKVTLNGLRRTDFVPANPLDVAAECTATANAATAQLTAASCVLPTEGGAPVSLNSALVDLARPAEAPLTIDAPKVSLPWLFGWFKVLSNRVPAEAAPAGELTAHLARPAVTGGPAQWAGSAQLALPAGAQHAAAAIQWTASPSTSWPGCTQAMVSPSAALPLQADATLSLATDVSACGLVLHGTGTATAAALQSAASVLPELTEGIPAVLPGAAPTRFDLTCTRPWAGPETCVQARPAAPVRKPARRRR